MSNDVLKAVVDEVAASIGPTVRTGVFVDLLSPDGRRYHGARYMVDYACVMDCDERGDMSVTTGTPVICTAIVKENSIRLDARPLHGLPDDSFAYDNVVSIELEGILDGDPAPSDVRQVYDRLAEDFDAIRGESDRLRSFGQLLASQRMAFRLSDLTERHLVKERSRTWKLAE